MVSFPPHSAKSVYALKMLDVVILKLVVFFGFFFLLLVYVAGSKVSKKHTKSICLFH